MEFRENAYKLLYIKDMARPIIAVIGVVSIVAITAFVLHSTLQSNPDTQDIIAECGKTPTYTCLRQSILSKIAAQGVSRGYSAIESWYRATPSFRPICFSFGLDIARAVYNMPNHGQPLDITPQITVCNYAFLQEYARLLSEHSETPGSAANFCKSVGEKINSSIPNAEAECFRGFGRGLSDSAPLSRLDAYKAAAKAIHMCDSSAPPGLPFEYCTAGLYHRFTEGTARPRPELMRPGTDPLALCRAQPERVRPRCFGNLKWNIIKTVFSSTTPEHIFSAHSSITAAYGSLVADYHFTIVSTLAYDAARASLSSPQNFSAHAKDCRLFDSKLSRECVYGFAVGLAKNGIPHQQHEAVFDFCSAARAEDLDTTYCLQGAMIYLQGLYSQTEFKRTCKEMERRFNTSCSSFDAAIDYRPI